MLIILWASLFVFTVFASWLVNLLGLPGNWLIVAACALYAWLVPEDIRVAIGWPATGVILGLAVLGEIAEFVASAAGVKKSGGSGFAAFLALIGSVIGAIAGMFVGVPVPIVGSLVAAVVFGGFGALGGAMLGEMMLGRTPEESFNVGVAAFWGRLLGTFAKTLIGAVMAGIAIASVFVK